MNEPMTYEWLEMTYKGDFGQPWVAWLKYQEALGWEFRSGKCAGSKSAIVWFRRPVKTTAASNKRGAK